jgi:hypothetical protein
MKTENMTQYRPGMLRPDLGANAAGATTAAAREERLQTLYAKWQQFATEYTAMQEKNDQEVMTNLRGLMILIKKEIVRLGGEVPQFPYADEPHLADL